MLDWSHIKSAPRDGSEFLAYDVLTKKFDVCVMVQYGKEWQAQPVQSDGEYGPSTGEFGYESRGIMLWAPLEPIDLDALRQLTPADG